MVVIILLESQFHTAIDRHCLATPSLALSLFLSFSLWRWASSTERGRSEATPSIWTIILETFHAETSSTATALASR
jgi:hypothetical protein